MQIAFVVGQGVAFLFFGACLLYLLRLLVHAAILRGKAPALFPPSVSDFSSTLSLREGQEIRAAQGETRKRFAILIPAHDEALTLNAALDGIKKLDYPSDAFRVVVIADNCTDETAQIAVNAGVLVLERTNQEEIGKGYALEWAMGQLFKGAANSPVREIADFDALVILDADTIVARDLLLCFEQGLNLGEEALQARYEVLNVDESWRTRLMACALSLAHIVKPLGREHLSLSDGLKGNGMCFARSVVERVPWSGASITEDIEYTLRLCRAEVRIVFLPQTAVWAQMPTTGKQAVSQRKRWEGGRYQLLFHVAPRTFQEGIARKNRLLTDRAIELIIPPFAELVAVPVLFLVIALICGKVFGWQSAELFSIGWMLLLVLEAVYLFGGLWVSRTPARVMVSLLAAPFYILWKLSLYPVMLISRKTSGEWKRTERREM